MLSLRLGPSRGLPGFLTQAHAEPITVTASCIVRFASCCQVGTNSVSNAKTETNKKPRNVARLEFNFRPKSYELLDSFKS
jgi:hypothetical protein